MPLTTIYTDTQPTAEHFGSYEPDQYAGTTVEARAELAYWVEQGWARTAPDAEFAHEVTDELMRSFIRRWVVARTA